MCVGRRRGVEPLIPAMSRLSINEIASSIPDDNNVGGAPEFESPPMLDWQQFKQYLLQRMTAKTAEDRLRYAKQYASVLLYKGVMLLPITIRRY